MSCSGMKTLVRLRPECPLEPVVHDDSGIPPDDWFVVHSLKFSISSLKLFISSLKLFFHKVDLLNDNLPMTVSSSPESVSRYSFLPLSSSIEQ